MGKLAPDDRFVSSVGMGVPPAKLHERPVTPAVLPPVALADRRRDRRRHNRFYKNLHRRKWL
ncbi:hypothetical protein SBA3_2230006 [Candidatus Sulfopaludibacter sp. SbA3]|nr:hypothetical protein SBA3_2230006 [Candidatus Sulfopaludibacter sp. SbA3]